MGIQNKNKPPSDQQLPILQGYSNSRFLEKQLDLLINSVVF